MSKTTHDFFNVLFDKLSNAIPHSPSSVIDIKNIRTKETLNYGYTYMSDRGGVAVTINVNTPERGISIKYYPPKTFSDPAKVEAVIVYKNEYINEYINDIYEPVSETDTLKVIMMLADMELSETIFISTNSERRSDSPILKVMVVLDKIIEQRKKLAEKFIDLHHKIQQRFEKIVPSNIPFEKDSVGVNDIRWSHELAVEGSIIVLFKNKYFLNLYLKLTDYTPHGCLEENGGIKYDIDFEVVENIIDRLFHIVNTDFDNDEAKEAAFLSIWETVSPFSCPEQESDNQEESTTSPPEPVKEKAIMQPSLYSDEFKSNLNTFIEYGDTSMANSLYYGFCRAAAIMDGVCIKADTYHDTYPVDKEMKLKNIIEKLYEEFVGGPESDVVVLRVASIEHDISTNGELAIIFITKKTCLCGVYVKLHVANGVVQFNGNKTSIERIKQKE